MKQNTILIAATAMLVGGITVYLFLSDHDSDGYGMGNMVHEQMGEGNENSMGNMEGMDHSMMMTVTSEREFLTGMIPHHQEAVNTAKEVLERGGSTEGVRTLVEDIVVAQEKEIADMKQWYSEWYGVTYEEKPEDYQPMMSELANLSGAELDKRFLEDMIMHHMGAIMMAQSVDAYIEHQEITDLGAAIKATQSAEIQLMRKLLTEI